MSQTYRATFAGDHVQWRDENPPGPGPLQVQITVLGPVATTTVPNGEAVAAAMQALADSGGIKSIPDPVAWQREIRRDRPLPGRDD